MTVKLPSQSFLQRTARAVKRSEQRPPTGGRAGGGVPRRLLGVIQVVTDNPDHVECEWLNDSGEVWGDSFYVAKPFDARESGNYTAGDIAVAAYVGYTGVSVASKPLFWIIAAGGVGNCFSARIGGASQIGPNRWSYAFTQVEYQTEGTYTDKTGGLTGNAYNDAEANNAATGVQGDGTDVGNLASGITMQPIGPQVVEISRRINCDTGATEYVFRASNNPGGACS